MATQAQGGDGGISRFRWETTSNLSSRGQSGASAPTMTASEDRAEVPSLPNHADARSAMASTTLMDVRAFVDGFRSSLRLTRARRRFRAAAYINSPTVSLDAELGSGVGIASGVVVNSGVVIGAHTYVNRGSLLTSGTIGQFCSIAHYVHIGPELHPLRHLSTSPNLYSPDRSILGASVRIDEIPAPPVIGNDVLIGAGAVVQQRVCIGDGAIVAAGAVVTDDVPPYAIVAGVKARVIGFRFGPATIERLLQDPWWEWGEDRHVELRRLVEAGEGWERLFLDGRDHRGRR